MPTYLERYNAGQRALVWAELLAFGDAVRADPLLTDAKWVAEETMRRVRHNIELLVPRLEAIGYQFGVLDDGSPVWQYPGPFAPPPSDIEDQIRRLEAMTGLLPLSLRAWYEVVGAVNFGGWHSEWAAAYHDPLWVDSLDLGYAQTEREDWEYLCGQEGREEIGPFVLPFAPDYYHKQNVSGGAPYGIALPNASADAVVENEWHGTAFVDYLRVCFRWGGFPGFEMVREEEGHRPLTHIAYLTQGLLPI